MASIRACEMCAAPLARPLPRKGCEEAAEVPVRFGPRPGTGALQRERAADRRDSAYFFGGNSAVNGVLWLMAFMIASIEVFPGSNVMSARPVG